MLAYVATVAERHPNLKLAIDHLATARASKGDAAFVHQDELMALAKHRNVSVKVSALPCNSVETYPFRDVHRHIRRAYDHFGPERMFWGSDLSRLPCSYRESWTYFDELPFLGEGDRRLIMGEAMCNWLNWPL
jgi:predicted TIM-barrel fold metal-dependent hydrolase